MPAGPTARLGAALLALALVGCGAGDDGDEKADAVPATEVPLTLPPTSERILADDPVEADPDEEVPAPTTEATPTTLRVGLPSDLGIPGAGNIGLGGGSSISNSFTVREVGFLEVVAFVGAELAADGWQVQQLPPEGDRVTFQFVGPGAVGEAQVAPQADGTVRVRIVLGGG